MKIVKFLFVVVFAFALSGCATIFTKSTSTLNVEAVNSRTNKIIPNARCVVKDSRGGVFPVGSNPGTVQLSRGMGAVNVSCNAPGYRQTAMGVGQTFNKVSLVNILAPIGFVVDALTGAIQTYPSHVKVLMAPV